MNRRQFFKNSIFSGIGLAVAGVFESTKAWAAELIKMNADGSAAHPQAKGLGYVSDLAKAMDSKAIQKASGLNAEKKKTDEKNSKVPAKEQTCAKCQFYPSGKDAKEGPCTLIPGVLVHGPGSCNTWVKKA